MTSDLTTLLAEADAVSAAATPVAWTTPEIVNYLTEKRSRSGLFQMAVHKQFDPKKECTVPLYGHPSASRDLIPRLVAACREQMAEIEWLREENLQMKAIINMIDNSCQRADETCAEPGITISEAARRTLIDERHHAFSDIQPAGKDTQ